MDLEIPGKLLAGSRQRGNAGAIQPRLAHRRRRGDAFGVASIEQARIEAPGDRAAAEKARGEAHALLFRECDDVEVKRQLAAEPPQMLGHDQRNEHAEPAVVFSGVADRVVVRRQDQRRRVRIVGGMAPDDIGERIDAGGEAGLAHQVADFGGNGTMRRGEIGAGQPVRDFRPLRQPVGKRHDPRAEHGLARRRCPRSVLPSP